MAADFGYGEVNEYRPVYDGVDWRQVFEMACLERGIPIPKPFWFEANDDQGLLEMQLTQENTAIYLNKTNPDLDAFAIRDERDDCPIWFSRQQLGGTQFEIIIAGMMGEVMVVQTKYPLKSVAEVLGMFALQDMATLEVDGLPEDFEANDGN